MGNGNSLQKKDKKTPAQEENVQAAEEETVIQDQFISVISGYRFKGNEFYKKFVDSTNFQDQRKYLQEAINLYRQAYDAGRGNYKMRLECSSAAKNCGTAAMRLVEILKEINASPLSIQHEHNMSIEFWSKALLSGKNCMSESWMNDAQSKYTECVQNALDHITEDISSEFKAGAIQMIIDVMSEDSQKAKCFLEMACFTFKMGVLALADNNYSKALQAFHDCYRPVEECKRLISCAAGEEETRTFILKEAKIIEDDLVFHLASAESFQALSSGDDLLKAALENYETLSIDLVYDVIDWYHQAIIRAREIEVVVEAMALSKMGSLYDTVLKIKYKAKEYFLRSMQLALSLQPRNFAYEKWHVDCAEALKRFQDEAARNDDIAKEEQRKKYLEELQSELAELKKTDNKSPTDTILHIYKTFPPKDPAHKINLEHLNDNNHIKKALRKAILHYHPDKQDEEKFGKKWVVLTEEISKVLTRMYENFKTPKSP